MMTLRTISTFIAVATMTAACSGSPQPSDDTTTGTTAVPEQQNASTPASATTPADVQQERTTPTTSSERADVLPQTASPLPLIGLAGLLLLGAAFGLRARRSSR
jgi:MYXO-CTERM domain-containing protein